MLLTDCFRFGGVIDDTREVLFASPSLTYVHIKLLGYIDSEIETHRNAQ